MQGGGVVGDVVVSCLGVFDLTILVLLDVFVVVQEKTGNKNKCKGRGVYCVHDWASRHVFDTWLSKKVSGVQQRHLLSKFTNRTDIL